MKRLRVEFADDFFSDGPVRELHEREPARATGLPINRHGNVRGLCDGGKVGSEVRLAGTVREISDEQTDCQGLLVKKHHLMSVALDSISTRHRELEVQGRIRNCVTAWGQKLVSRV